LVQNLTIACNGEGIFLAYCKNSTVTQNNITENYLGIYVRSSLNVSVFNNDVVDGEIGVTIANSSTSVYDNRVSRNDIGIALGYHASSASIFRNNITSNWRASILIFSRCSYNRIFENKIIDNSYGIEIDHSSNNEIWHNTLVNNDYQFVIAAGYANFSTALNFSGPFGSIDSFGVR
jgi:parallel beta-helix repeat protein